MESEWPRVLVGALAQSVSITHEMGKDQLIFLNTSDLHLGKVLHRKYSSVCDWPGQAKKSIRRDDILFSEIRPANGRWAFVDFDADDFVVSTKLMVIRANRQRVNPRFLYHFLTSAEITQWLQYLAESRSGTFPQITFDQVAQLEIALPPLREQGALARFLDAIEGKIELNRRMNETLEAMARALFKSWFVDFDPVRVKMKGRDPGLPKPIADLFPARLVESELGEIPEGWGVKRIEEVAERVAMGPFGSSIKVSTFVPEGIPVVSGQHLRGLILDDSDFNFVTCEHANQLHRSNVQRGDIVFTHAGSIGQVALIPDTSLYPRYVISQRQFYLRCERSKMSPLYVLLYFKTSEGQHRLLANTSSTGVPSLAQPVSYLRQLPLVIPPKPLLTHFGRYVGAWITKIAQNIDQSRTLAAVRDTLLPKLISGELRVKDAERIAESVA